MKDAGYGQGYQYDHDVTGGIAFDQTGFPDGMGEPEYYQPVKAGLESKISEKLAYIRSQRAQHNQEKKP